MNQFEKSKNNTEGMLDKDPEFKMLKKSVERAEELEDYLGEDKLSSDMKKILTQDQEKLKFFSEINNRIPN